jgi:hypothetical protein
VLGFLPPGDLGFSAGVAMDGRVLAYSFLISVATSVLFGLLPALQSFRTDLAQALGSAGMVIGMGKRKVNLRRLLVVIQIVASIVLLISSGLFLRGFYRGQTISNNFRTNRILLLNLTPKKYGYSVTYSKAFYRELLARMSSTPDGVG